LVEKDWQAVGKNCRFLSNFSAKNLLINSHQAHQIAAHPLHHLPMGLPDDNPSSFGDHYAALDVMLGSKGLASCWQLARIAAILVQLFSQNQVHSDWTSVHHSRLQCCVGYYYTMTQTTQKRKCVVPKLRV
jgi:hypothetical protein